MWCLFGYGMFTTAMECVHVIFAGVTSASPARKTL